MTSAHAKKFLGDNPSMETVLEFLRQSKPGSSGFSTGMAWIDGSLQPAGGQGYQPTQDGVPMYETGRRFFPTKEEAKAEAIRFKRETIAEYEQAIADQKSTEPSTPKQA